MIIMPISTKNVNKIFDNIMDISVNMCCVFKKNLVYLQFVLLLRELLVGSYGAIYRKGVHGIPRKWKLCFQFYFSKFGTYNGGKEDELEMLYKLGKWLFHFFLSPIIQ